MRHYEIVFLVHPDQSEQVSAMIDRYKEMVTSTGGDVHRVEDWGRRRLAYMINDVHKAHYIMINVECNLEALGEIEKNFKFNDSILRHLVIRRKEAITSESPLAKEKAEEERLEAEKRAREESEKSAQQAADLDAAEKKALEEVESLKEAEADAEISEDATEEESIIVEEAE